MEKKWWHSKIAYQIYPKSFYDTNGDGIGDLRGIIEKLDYIKSLGVGLIWISPFYASPLADQGYDISDYYAIDPRFGTLEDLEELIFEGKKRDISIIMDLVVNHCSDEHEWFRDAVKDPCGEHGKFFYIEQGKKDEATGAWMPPYNWRSYFGGYAWSPLPGWEKDGLFYLHSFHEKQPDLNWTNPALREEIYKMMNWWLDKGLGGFRIDAIVNIKKTEVFVDYKPDRPDGTAHVTRMIDEAEGVLELLNEMRDRTFAIHDAFSVGEVFNSKADELRGFIGENGCFSSMFGFDQVGCGSGGKGWWSDHEIDPDEYREKVFGGQLAAQAAGGFLSNIIENHDEPRGVSHFIPAAQLCDESKKMLAVFYYFLRGIPFIYQGQELGMENTHFDSMEQVDDVSSHDEYEAALLWGASPEQALAGVNRLSRDHTRTPFQWSDQEHAGFTTGTPWLAVNKNYVRINAKKQESDPNSVLNFYRKLGELHRRSELEDALVYGDFVPFGTDESKLLAYYRVGTDKKVLILCNFSPRDKEVSLPTGDYRILLDNLDHEDVKQGMMQCTESCLLKAHQALVLEVLN